MSDIIRDFELLKCPFCGGNAIMESWDMSPYERMHIETTDGKWYSVFCNDCLSCGSDCISAYNAAKAWNSRVGG